MRELPDHCMLCPRTCGTNRRAGDQGVCEADDSLKVARAALHRWEEPIISVGAGSGTVFFSGCPLRCIYCQNRPIALGKSGIEISTARLADIFFELADQGAANINLVTPTHYVLQIMDAIDCARSRGFELPFVYNTSGYECAHVISQLKGYIDVFLTDFKYFSSETAQKYSHAPDYFDVALAALDAMCVVAPVLAMDSTPDGPKITSGIVVRHLILPGHIQESKDLLDMLWNRYGSRVLYSVMNQYTPTGSFANTSELERHVTSAEYEDVLDHLDSIGMSEYFWQEGGADSESFIPPFDNTGVLLSAKPCVKSAR